MDVLENLEGYLLYMGQLGFQGLALEENPFVVKTEVPRPGASPQPSPRSSAPPPVIPKKQVEKKPEKKPEMPNLFSILDMVESVSTDNREKAAQIKGDNSVEVLRNLYHAFHKCEACALGTTRRRFVFGEGPPDANLMFVGEGPGEEEDLAARPFVGKAGELLTKIIEAMGWRRSDVFISYAVKCRLPGNRSPLPDELSTCSPILARQIETVKPKVIVALGPTALRFFRGQDASLLRSRGQFFQWKEHLVMPTYAPSHVLRNPRSKREVWEDMKQVMAKLGER